ncbi:hypothetical protein DSUL_30112 [Desulfovibrionales bacterium]
MFLPVVLDTDYFVGVCKKSNQAAIYVLIFNISIFFMRFFNLDACYNRQ